jgi:hypothetical protein
VGSFGAAWLALREPADHAARSVRLTRAIVEAIGPDPAPPILDLAAGTGSNLRYLTGHLPGARWLLVDRDRALLARVAQTAAVETRVVDLASPSGLERTLFAGRALVTASALLDLVSEAWLHALADRCAPHRSTVLFALSYDGRIECSPGDEHDAAIVALVNDHQRTDKGFGAALGPDATACAERCFVDAGHHVERARSDWVLPPDARELQRQLIDGWARAATAIAPSRAATIDGWRTRRLAHVAANRSRIIVGHEDLMGVPRS